MTPKRKTETDHFSHATGSANEPGSTPKVPYTAIFPPVHPGFTLAEFLEERSLDVKQCAKQCGLSARVIQDLLDGTIPVVGAIAAALEAGGFGPSAEYWLGKERLYQQALEHYGQTRSPVVLPCRHD